MSETLLAAARALGVDGFERPVLALPLVALVLVGLWLAARRRPAALPWPAWVEARAAGARRRDPGRVLGLLARGAALLALGAVLAGPVAERRTAPPPGEGLDLVLVVDASGSMRALDAEVEGEWRTRLDLARAVVARFALQRLAEGDRVGLVVFGETAFTQCPLTSDGRLLAGSLERVRPGVAGEATALGDALALAVKRAAGAERGADATAPIAGRVVVLLTDGRSNAGAVPPDVATGIARARGVRVHTVGIGTGGEVAMQQPEGAARRGLQFERHDLDAPTLEAIAAATGGSYFAARSSADLESVYAAIDALERVARPAPPRRRSTPRPEPFLALAGVLVALEAASGRGLLRRIP
ncbi:MAG: VWA domain-containing protein [Myxococcota bacterium]|nr:VWA domain-containing protein [Myxococcota bacterium]